MLTDAVDVGADGDRRRQAIFGGSVTVQSKVSTGMPVITVRPNAIAAGAGAGAAAEVPVAVTVSDAAKRRRSSSGSSRPRARARS